MQEESKKLNITIISDTHGMTIPDNLLKSGGDILIHCGDVSNRGSESEIKKFCEWFDSLHNFKYKIFIAGNHDFFFQDNSEEVISDFLKNYTNIIYLQDSFTIIEGIKIYGTPWQPWFYDWAFNLDRDGKELWQRMESIPMDTDILITHSPPKNILDKTRDDKYVGCQFLSDRVSVVRPKIHCFGHIHEAYGVKDKNGTLFVNASLLNDKYYLTNYPHELYYFI